MGRTGAKYNCKWMAKKGEDNNTCQLGGWGAKKKGENNRLGEQVKKWEETSLRKRNRPISQRNEWLRKGKRQ